MGIEGPRRKIFGNAGPERRVLRDEEIPYEQNATFEDTEQRKTTNFETGRDRMDRKAVQIHAHARKLLSENQFKMSEFIDIYKEKVIEDLERVKRIVAQLFEKDHRFSPEEAAQTEKMKKIATICEAAIFRGIKEKHWLGKNAQVKATSPYDEKINGVDLAVQFTESSEDEGEEAEEAHLGLAIDVTFASDFKKKFDAIKNDIDNGRLTELKYVKSLNNTPLKGMRVSRVVVGLDNEHMKDIIMRWDGEGGDPLEGASLRDICIEEIHRQLSVFKEYAKSIGQHDVASVYERDLKIIEKILTQNPLSTKEEDRASDRVYNGVNENLQQFKVSKH